MKTIWKFPIKLQDRFILNMPKGAEILTVQTQNGDAMLWAIVEPYADKVMRTFALQGTGNPFELDDYKYIGTYQERVFVWHLFEIQNP